MGEAAGVRLATRGLTAPSRSGPMDPQPPERAWHSGLQEWHRYRGWVWPGGQLSVVHAARLVALETLADWQLDLMADDVALCMSELMANALTHARAPIDRLMPDKVVLGLRHFPGTCLFVEVGDCDSNAPRFPSEADDDLESMLAVDGRGLLIVRELADDLWWRRRGTGGKYVYARLDTRRYYESENEVCR
jgi:anti-sigma regulatory factor (Ser/Thr protein kinase)